MLLQELLTLLLTWHIAEGAHLEPAVETGTPLTLEPSLAAEAQRIATEKYVARQAQFSALRAAGMYSNICIYCTA